MTSAGRIRVLQLGSPTGLYGAERWILALVRHLDPTRVDSEVATVLDDPDLNADLCREAQRMGIRSTVFEAHGKFNWAAVRALRRHVRQNAIDIVHTHGYKSDVVGLLATRGTSCKIITTPHGWSVNAGYKLRFYETLDRAAFGFFDRVVPLSQDLYDGLKSIPFVRRKLRLITNGVDLRDIDETSVLAEEIREWKAHGHFVIGYIGQLIARKGLDQLLKALAGIELRTWRLAIVGDGPAAAALAQLARERGLDDRVRFFGFRDDRLAFLKGFDLFVLPSRLEGVPRCLMEAMAGRVPVAASDIPGCRDLVRHGQTGLLFDPGDVEAIRRTVLQTMRDDGLRERLKAQARRSIETEWSAENMARKYMQLYDELVAV